MVLSDFIQYNNHTNKIFPVIKLKKDPQHKVTSPCNIGDLYIDNTEAIFLIKRARESFLTHIKLKDKHIKTKYIDSGLNPKLIKTHFYQSTDKKFYCVYVNIIIRDSFGCYMFGIIEKSTNKHLIMTYEIKTKISNSYERICEKYRISHHIFDYQPDIKYIDKLRNIDPYLFLSDDNSKTLGKYHKPLDIIDAIEDYFEVFYDEIYDKSHNNDDFFNQNND